MGIPELPTAAAKLSHACKETSLRHLVSFRIGLDFRVRSRHDRQIRGQRIDAQVVAPTKLDMLDDAGKILNSLRRDLPVGKDKVSLHCHEESWIVREFFLPCSRTLLGDIMRHGENKIPDGAFDRRPALWR